MREWLKTIQAVDELVARAVDDGLYAIEDEQRFLVTDTWESGPELVETVSGWRGTRISRALAERTVTARAPVCVHQEVRLRVLRSVKLSRTECRDDREDGAQPRVEWLRLPL
jgi:hypothetical protein